MWAEWILPRLRERGLGDGRLVRTLRTYGIGESHVAELLGEPMLRAANPVVATYARADWLDIRISAVDELDPDGQVTRPAAEVLDAATGVVRELLEGFVRAEGETSWADLVAEATREAGVRFAIVEVGTRRALGGLLADVPALERSVALGPLGGRDLATWPVEDEAAAVARASGVEVGLALIAETDDARTLLRAAVAAADGHWARPLDLRLFQHGPHGLFRAAVAAAAHLAEVLREPG
jgi:hypothetical protein